MIGWHTQCNVKDCHLRNGAVQKSWLGKLDRGDQLSFVAELQLKVADVFGEAVRLVGMYFECILNVFGEAVCLAEFFLQM